MRVAEPWVRRCRACAFMISTLPPGAGRGVAGLRPLRVRNFETILDRLEQLLPIRGARLLEVGCAEGWFLERATGRGMQVEGIEPHPNLQARHDTPGLNMRPGYFPDAVDQGASYAVIVFNDVFEHLAQPHRAIVDVEQRLEPGGLAVLNLPSSRGLLFRAARLLHRFGISGPYERLWQKGMDSPHLSYFNPRNLRCFVERHTALRHVLTCRLAVMARDGLWQRISSTYSRAASAAVFAIAWPTTFVLAWFSSDAELVVFRKERVQ